MARYRVLEKSYIGDRLVEEGEIIEYELPAGSMAGSNLEPIDGAPKSSPRRNPPPARP
jgi:hypothetical protein